MQINLKAKVKTIWKSLMRVALRLYVHNPNLYIKNNILNLDSKTFYSQFGQDMYVFETLFNKRQSGVFVDVGGNHPISCSNTYLLESKGWTGIAIEPQKELRDLWKEYRRTPCLNYVIGSENKKVSFVEGNPDEHGLAGVEGFNKVTNISNTIEVNQIRLDDLLKQHNISNVDYLSIDVEGYEMNVLYGIDFTKLNIKVISIENDINFTGIPLIGKRLGSELGNNKLRNFIITKGYSYVGRIMCDDFFVKNE